MKIYITIISLCLVSNILSAQLPSYNDVLVVANSNNSESVYLAQYFAAERNIPRQNLCIIPMPLEEEIDSSQFFYLKEKIREYINNTFGADSVTLTYIVTIQGVPLKVRGGTMVGDGNFSSTSSWASFDSELMLLQSQRENKIGKRGPTVNDFYLSNAEFLRSSTYRNIRLVTRIGGYALSDRVKMINNAIAPVDTNGVIVIDMDPIKYAIVPWLLTSAYDARRYLELNNKKFVYDSSTTYLQNLENVVGYVSFYHQDAGALSQGAWRNYPNHKFSSRAIGELYASFSASSLVDSLFSNPYFDKIGIFIQNGISGIKGYVYEPFSSAVMLPSNFIPQWVQNKKWADVAWSASSRLSWNDVVLGDPKMTYR